MIVSGRPAIIEKRDSRSFRVLSFDPFGVKEIVNDKSQIIRIKSKDFDFEVGKTYKIDKWKYKVHLIEPALSDSLQYILSIQVELLSTIFLTPMLKMTKSEMLYDLLVNAFVGDPVYKNKIVLLYRFHGGPEFLKFEKAVKQHACFIETYDPSPEYVLFVFDVPDIYKEDYDKFLKGKYSKMSDSFKDLVIKFNDFSLIGRTRQIFDKNPDLKRLMEQVIQVSLPDDAELHSIVNIEEETFNPDLYCDE